MLIMVQAQHQAMLPSMSLLYSQWKMFASTYQTILWLVQKLILFNIGINRSYKGHPIYMAADTSCYSVLEELISDLFKKVEQFLPPFFQQQLH
jgi:hypothetical protein